jgi:hypothetical protein
MFQDVSDNPFQNSKRTLQEILWKPLVEVAGIIRGVGRFDPKMHGHAPSTMAAPGEAGEADPTSKKHTVKMIMFTQLTEDDETIS